MNFLLTCVIYNKKHLDLSIINIFNWIRNAVSN